MKQVKTSNRLLHRSAEVPETPCYKLREHLKVSQSAFAALLGVHRETVGAIERGRRPSPLTQRELNRLAKKHGISLETGDQ